MVTSKKTSPLRTIWKVTVINFQRWKNDRRIWIIFLATGLLLIYDLRGLLQYGMDNQEQCTIYLLPLLFSTSSISIGSAKMFIYLGCLLLLCDAPFLYSNTPYVVMRSGRNSWWIGECLYIFITTFLYLCFITIISIAIVLPVATFGESWGDVIRAFLYGNTISSAVDLVNMYKVYLPIRADLLTYFLPAGTQVYVFFSAWASFLFIGLVQYMVNLVSRSNFLGFACAGVFVFLEPLLQPMLLYREQHWMQIFSPVCWTNALCLKIVDPFSILTVPLVALLFGVLFIVLIAGIWRLSQRVMIEARKEEKQ